MKLQFDPLSVPAKKSDVKRVWKEVLQLPVAASNGLVFQFDRDSRELMEFAIIGLRSMGAGAQIKWRLNDNTEIPVTAETLQSYYDDLVRVQALRGMSVDAQYMVFKKSPATMRSLKAWKDSHIT